jgi:hypothetical protein
MRRFIIFIIGISLAAVAPLYSAQRGRPATEGQFPGWPTHFEGRALTTLPLSERELRFGRGFPGRIGRFTDGRREIVLRLVTQETRMLHPAADCFRGLGYTISPLPVRLDGEGRRWGVFEARRGEEHLLVSERIYSAADGGAWSDVSTWYWSALVGRSRGPWWAVTIASSPEGPDSQSRH